MLFRSAGVLINAGRFWFYRRAVNLRAMGFVCAGALPMLLVGTWIFAVLDARTLGIVLAAFVLGSVPLRRVLKRRELTLGPKGLVAGAGVFGLASGFASGTGVILISLLLGAGFGGTTVLATDALVTIIVDLARAALYGRFDLLDARYATLGFAIGIVTFPGSWLAAFLVERMGARLHTLAIEALIAVGGIVVLAGDETPTDSVTAAPLELGLGDGPGIASCLPVSADILRDMSPALLGTATAVDGEKVTLAIDHWYAGDTGATEIGRAHV